MKKKSVVKATPIKPKIDSNKILMENFVALQRVLTNLALKLDNLSGNISKLLELFEVSAKSFAEKQGIGGNIITEKDKEFLEKIDRLLEQNKTIAKGLTLMEEKMRQRVYGSPPQQQQRNIPRF